IRSLERRERRLFLTQRVVDQRDPERRYVLLPRARLELVQDSASVERPARCRICVPQIRLESLIATRSRFNSGFELADRIVQTADEQERHPELEVCARAPGRELERAAELRDRPVVLTRRPGCDALIDVGIERERIPFARAFGFGGGLCKPTAADERRDRDRFKGAGAELSRARELLVAIFPPPV